MLAIFVSHATLAAPGDVENVIKRNGLDNTRIMALYRSGELVAKEDAQNNVLELVNPAVDTPNSTTRNTKYWYQSMPLTEYKAFDATGYTALPCTQQYTSCMLTLEYRYTQKSLSKEKPGF